MSFDVQRALRNWHREYPDREERILVLRRELSRCFGGTVAVRGHRISRECPETARRIRLMLAVLER